MSRQLNERFLNAEQLPIWCVVPGSGPSLVQCLASILYAETIGICMSARASANRSYCFGTGDIPFAGYIAKSISFGILAGIPKRIVFLAILFSTVNTLG